MQKVLVGFFLVALPVLVFAQQGNEIVQRSSSPLGLRIQDNRQAGTGTDALNTSSALAGERNTAGSAAAQGGNVKGALQIQGNTTIKANARNVNAVAAGRSSAAGNEVGAIGK
jgi:hypothetical protein